MSEFSEIEIQASQGTYLVKIGHGQVEDLLKNQSIYVVIDESLLALFPWLAHDNALALVAREEEKTLEAAAKLIGRLRELGANRESEILAIGGGIVQDISTFVASTYMRGIRWSYCPTTLLGMVDSCIGGKSSINVGKYKNIAGNIYPPERIFVDTTFCETLPRVELISGLFEAVKICYAEKYNAFETFITLSGPDQQLNDPKYLAEVIRLSLSTKKQFIEQDEFDLGIRLLLNFGHTFGHALEGASDFEISHGIAVGMGMLVALYFAEDFGLLNSRVPRVIALQNYILDLMRQAGSVIHDVHNVIPERALRCFKSDKKHTHTHYIIIAYGEDGYLQRVSVPISLKSERTILRAFEKLKEELNEI